MTIRKLTPEQAELKAMALTQLSVAAETLERLGAIPAGQADCEALADAAELLERGTVCLRDWFGGCPSPPFDD